MLIHCYGGLGRTCLLAAALLLNLDQNLLPADAINLLRYISQINVSINDIISWADTGFFQWEGGAETCPYRIEMEI